MKRSFAALAAVFIALATVKSGRIALQYAAGFVKFRLVRIKPL